MLRRKSKSPQLSLDDPEVTLHRRKLLQDKKYLHEIYEEWYDLLIQELPQDAQNILELGSGPGFLQDRLPQVKTSEIFELPGIDCVQDATHLDEDDDSLDAIVMTDVLHHVQDIRAFFHEASRCLRPGGKMVAIEPWNNSWSSFIYRNFHHEPFLPSTEHWELPEGGPLSTANGALPYICFERDRGIFEKEFPQLIILRIRVLMPISYLLSGGFSLPSLVPRSTYRLIRRGERLLHERKWGMFALIVLEKRVAED